MSEVIARYEYAYAVIEVRESFLTKDVAPNSIALLIKVTSLNYEIPVKKATVMITGQDSSCPHFTNDNGEVFLIISNPKFQLTINPVEDSFDNIQMSDIPLKKGQQYTIRVIMTPK